MRNRQEIKKIKTPEGERAKPEKENLLEGVPSELVERFGKENLRNLTEDIKKSAKEKLDMAYKRYDKARLDAKRFAQGWGIQAGHHEALSAGYRDAIYRVLTGKNLFTQPKDKEFLSEEEKKAFSEKAERHALVNAVDEAAYHLIRTGEKLGTTEEQKTIVEFLENEFQRASIAGLGISDSGYVQLGQYAAIYRIFTGKSLEHLLKTAIDPKKAKNDITEKLIIDKLVKEINDHLKTPPTSMVYLVSLGRAEQMIADFRILTAKKIDIIPGKGIVFPEEEEKPKDKN